MFNWPNHYNMWRNAFNTMCHNDDYVDVTIWCEKRMIRGHKCILAGSSNYFDMIFKDLQRIQSPQSHTVVAIENVRFDDLQAVIRYIYDGQIRVPDKERGPFLATAQLLGVVVDADKRQPIDPDVDSGTSSFAQMSSSNSNDSPSNQVVQIAKGILSIASIRNK